MGRVFGNDNPGLNFRELTDAEILIIQGIGALGDPNADRILFWDDSANSIQYLTAGTGLSITGTTLTATGGSGGHVIQDEGTPLTARGNLNFVGAGVTVTDGGAGPDSTIVTISTSAAASSFSRTFAMMGA